MSLSATVAALLTFVHLFSPNLLLARIGMRCRYSLLIQRGLVFGINCGEITFFKARINEADGTCLGIIRRAADYL